jgi:hypothetical protein
MSTRRGFLRFLGLGAVAAPALPKILEAPCWDFPTTIPRARFGLPPVVFQGGAGTGEMFEVTMADGVVSAVSIAGGGSGYEIGDIVTLSFSGGGQSA